VLLLLAVAAGVLGGALVRLDRVRRVSVVVRAQAAAWRENGRRFRHQLVSAVLIAGGLAGALGGGALVGTWCLGLVLIAESGLAVWFGLQRDDGAVLPPPPRRGGPRSHEEILEMARHAP
jgi:hypothetical protein